MTILIALSLTLALGIALSTMPFAGNANAALDSTEILHNIQTIPHYCATNSC